MRKKITILCSSLLFLISCSKDSQKEVEEDLFVIKLPTVVTAEPKQVTGITAILGGEVTSGNNSEITEVGIVFSNKQNFNPNSATKITVPGITSGSFSVDIKELDHSTAYYVKAYAYDGSDTYYGEEKKFETLSFHLNTEKGIIGLTTAWIRVTFLDELSEGETIEKQGLVWSSSLENPSLDNKEGTMEITADPVKEGVFTAQITGLREGTPYYVRAYAISDEGAVSYGNSISFTTLSIANLPSVKIGSDIWTATNLDLDEYTDGTPIPQITDAEEWKKATTGAWCYLNNDLNMGEIYGKLYNYYAIEGIYNEASKTDPFYRKKLIPAGWHVPTGSPGEINNLLIAAGATSGSKYIDNINVINKLKSDSVLWNNSTGNNQTGFSALPGGRRDPSRIGGEYFDSTENFYFWSTYNSGQRSGQYVQLNARFIDIKTYNTAQKNYGMSIRLVKDK